MTDEFATYDAAYLLGALTPADRSAYEAHLAGCPSCRRAVSQLAGLPGLLASVAPDRALTAGGAGPDIPETLLPRLLAEVQRTRFRRRMTTGVIGVAAAAVLAVALILAPHDHPPAPDAGPPVSHSVAQPMTPASAGVPISATAQLDDKAWGTQIVVRCVYLAKPNHHYQGGLTYLMVVTDKAGSSQQIASWEARPGAPIVVDGSTSVRRAQIASVEVRTTDDRPILTLRL